MKPKKTKLLKFKDKKLKKFQESEKWKRINKDKRNK